VVSVASGAWSSPATWSTKKVPGANDRVLITAGHAVTYDAVSDAKLTCIELRGHLTFRTDASTRMKVVNLMVMEGGTLDVGTPARPVAPAVTADIVIADQAPDPAADPAQVGPGIEGLGKITMTGAATTPPFARLAKEPLAGQHTHLRAACRVVAARRPDRDPDTRQLRRTNGDGQLPLPGRAAADRIGGRRDVTLTAALKFDHKGARDSDGNLAFLPHVGNLTRNVKVRSRTRMVSAATRSSWRARKSTCAVEVGEMTHAHGRPRQHRV
jgi:hypothetical protein